MKTGEIVVNGDCGMHTGEKMLGGKITVNGNVGGWTGNEMKAGTIEIHGDAGDYLSFTLQRQQQYRYERRLDNC